MAEASRTTLHASTKTSEAQHPVFCWCSQALLQCKSANTIPNTTAKVTLTHCITVVGIVQVKGVVPAVTREQQAEVVNAAAPFQNAYLGAALTRMSDAVTAAFPGTSRTLASSAELQKCIA